MLVPNPGFLTFCRHKMLLAHTRISELEAEALRNYLLNTKNVKEQKVHNLIIESCHMTDISYSKILEGLWHQCQMYDKSKYEKTSRIKVQAIESLTYSNNSFGVKSLERLLPLIPHIFEI